MRIGRIDYINTLPIYHHLGRELLPAGSRVIGGTPDVLNGLMAEGKLDVSPVSSIAYGENHRDWLLLPELSISCLDKVLSVLAVSREPIDKLQGKRIALTSESATSVALFKLLLQQKGVAAEFTTRKISGMQDLENGMDAAVIIGDTAISHPWAENFAHVYDLGELWNRCTGKPFVFAVWAVRKEYARSHPEELAMVQKALISSKTRGLSDISPITMEACRRKGFSPEFCRTYYEHLNYDLENAHIGGLKTFFHGAFLNGILKEQVDVRFWENSVSGKAA